MGKVKNIVTQQPVVYSLLQIKQSTYNSLLEFTYWTFGDFSEIHPHPQSEMNQKSHLNYLMQVGIFTSCWWKNQILEYITWIHKAILFLVNSTGNGDGVIKWGMFSWPLIPNEYCCWLHGYNLSMLEWSLSASHQAHIWTERLQIVQGT